MNCKLPNGVKLKRLRQQTNMVEIIEKTVSQLVELYLRESLSEFGTIIADDSSPISGADL